MTGSKIFDLGAVLLALGITALSGALVYGKSGQETRLILRGAEARWIFPQNAGEIVAVPGPLGETVVELRNGEARILSSPCANQTCVAGGGIHRPGQWLACLPNRVFVSVEGGAGDDEPDALAW